MKSSPRHWGHESAGVDLRSNPEKIISTLVPSQVETRWVLALSWTCALPRVGKTFEPWVMWAARSIPEQSQGEHSYKRQSGWPLCIVTSSPSWFRDRDLAGLGAYILDLVSLKPDSVLSHARFRVLQQLMEPFCALFFSYKKVQKKQTHTHTPWGCCGSGGSGTSLEPQWL